ncbi:hypothetical protein KY290_024993 [Solanum tuberosum]|uniref:Uncharacterized protein n=1 Tax=Solanum tuberosum TaxID=4113 RepID=A0ABQ7UTG6_SOLTU|nr:hypothetical protein KY284_023849 [Solanum tuberosum]KAH0754723.1 hypothetical protein KY290_024993 [Solanum tuberosum]
MLDANSVSTPLSTSEILSLDNGSPSADATLYKHKQAPSIPTLSINLTLTSNKEASSLSERNHNLWTSLQTGKNPISWCSNKQRIVAKSSTEAEYRAVASAVAELNWLTNLLQELRVRLPCPPKVFCDNIGVTYLCRKPVFHNRMKHVGIDFHFVRDQVESGNFLVHYIPTGAQLADALTKALPKGPFSTLLATLVSSKLSQC